MVNEESIVRDEMILGRNASSSSASDGSHRWHHPIRLLLQLMLVTKTTCNTVIIGKRNTGRQYAVTQIVCRSTAGLVSYIECLSVIALVYLVSLHFIHSLKWSSSLCCKW